MAAVIADVCTAEILRDKFLAARHSGRLARLSDAGYERTKELRDKYGELSAATARVMLESEQADLVRILKICTGHAVAGDPFAAGNDVIRKV
jgi:hypothetical protein